jgi:hypothetical protein
MFSSRLPLLLAKNISVLPDEYETGAIPAYLASFAGVENLRMSPMQERS